MSKNRVSYYGPLFWLAIVSFSVPIVVAAKAFHEVRVTSKPTPHPDASGVDHALWDYLLKSYVENGLIDYDGMARDHLFRTYLRQLSEAEPEKLTTSADQLAPEPMVLDVGVAAAAVRAKPRVAGRQRPRAHLLSTLLAELPFSRDGGAGNTLHRSRVLRFRHDVGGVCSLVSFSDPWFRATSSGSKLYWSAARKGL